MSNTKMINDQESYQMTEQYQDYIKNKEHLSSHPEKQKFYLGSINQAILLNDPERWMEGTLNMTPEIYLKFELFMSKLLNVTLESDKDCVFHRLRTTIFLQMITLGSSPSFMAFMSGVSRNIVKNIYLTYCSALADLPIPNDWMEVRQSLLSSLSDSDHEDMLALHNELVNRPTMLGYGVSWLVDTFSDEGDEEIDLPLHISTFLDLTGNIQTINVKPLTETGLPPPLEEKLMSTTFRSLSSEQKQLATYQENDQHKKQFIDQVGALRLNSFLFPSLTTITPEFSEVFCDKMTLLYWRATLTTDTDVYCRHSTRQMIMDEMLHKAIVQQNPTPNSYLDLLHSYQDIYNTYFDDPNNPVPPTPSPESLSHLYPIWCDSINSMKQAMGRYGPFNRVWHDVDEDNSHLSLINAIKAVSVLVSFNNQDGEMEL